MGPGSPEGSRVAYTVELWMHKLVEKVSSRHAQAACLAELVPRARCAGEPVVAPCYTVLPSRGRKRNMCCCSIPSGSVLL
jgi:hypothetical protein